MYILHRSGMLLFLASTLVIFYSCDQTKMENTPSQDSVLWYTAPAQNWNEALPLGNGRLGIMVFGNTSRERIQLNDDSLWPEDAGWDEPDGNKDDLQKIRELLFQGNNTGADALFVDKFSRKSIVRSHQTLGDLFIDFEHNNITEYKRELNLDDASVNISYLTNGQLVTEKAFVSHPNRAIVIELNSEATNGLNGKIRLSRPMDHEIPTTEVKTTDDKLLVMSGEVTQRGAKFESEPYPLLDGVKFETCLKIENEGGEVINGPDFLELKNVRKATLIIVANSSYYHENYQEQNVTDLEAVNGLSYDAIKLQHTMDYQDLYSRVELKLTDHPLDSIPTDQRLERIKEGKSDPGLESMLFQYGRYLLISSSRPGTNPANLQGLWNEHIEAPWNADYHLNINLQMNYWLADATNLSELNSPLFEFIDRLLENGKAVAMNNFGCRGSFVPHATDLWAPAWLRAPTAYWGCSIGAGGWMVQHYWEHFEFTADTTFLETRAYPAIYQVAQFYSDWLIEDPRDGKLISAPSTSPENRFFNDKGESVATCLGSAMDQQVIAEVFDNFILASDLLGERDSLYETIIKQQTQLRPGFVIGSDGRILEWDREYAEPEPGHRHMSHVYGFHPGTAITKEGTPDIFEAVRKTLDYRLANGGAGTGWSRAWLINFCARLLDGEQAYRHIQLLLQKSISNNLFDLHPPFQIDGNFGYTSGVTEMLLQSHEEEVLRILPSLPAAWSNGHIKGIKARGQVEIDLFWKNSVLIRLAIRPHFDGKKKLVYRNKTKILDLKAGTEYVFDRSDISNWDEFPILD